MPGTAWQAARGAEAAGEASQPWLETGTQIQIISRRWNSLCRFWSSATADACLRQRAVVLAHADTSHSNTDADPINVMKITSNLTSSEWFQYKNCWTDKLCTARCIGRSVRFSVLFDHFQQLILSPAFWFRVFLAAWFSAWVQFGFFHPKKAEQN